MKHDQDDKVVSAKHAMDDYFQVMLGDVSQERDASPVVDQSSVTPEGTASQSEKKTESKVGEGFVKGGEPSASTLLSETQNFNSVPLLNRKSAQRPTQVVPQLDETPDIKRPVASPIIPAAFPKLAPKVEEPKIVAPPVVEARVQTEAQVNAKTKQDPVAPPKTEPIVDEVVEQSIEKQVLAEEALAPVVHKTNEPKAWRDNGRPDWGQERFECLLFSVAGLKLAVPLVSLGSIHKLDQDLTPLVGRASWFMGLYRSGDRNIRVVDTAKWVMPDRYHDQVKDGYKFIIRLGDSDWGMACDAVAEAIQLEPDQVKWRSERSKRPWLSGTVIDHMCALLDADMLGYLLDQDARKH